MVTLFFTSKVGWKENWLTWFMLRVNSKHPLNIYHDWFYFKARLRSTANIFFCKSEKRGYSASSHVIELSAMNIIRFKNWVLNVYREYFMESAGVRYLRTSYWRIRNRTSERSERVRFLIQKQRERKYRTKHFPCGIVFII